MSRTFTFAVIVEAKSEQLAFQAAMSNPLTKPSLDGRINYKLLDSWVIFPWDKHAMFRVNGVLNGAPPNYTPQLAAISTGEKRSDTCWALKIRPIIAGNVRLVFFGRGDELRGPVTIGPSKYEFEGKDGQVFISDQ